MNASLEILSKIENSTNFYGVATWFQLFSITIEQNKDQFMRKLADLLLSKLIQFGQIVYSLRNPYYRILSTYFKIDELPLEKNLFSFRSIFFKFFCFLF